MTIKGKERAMVSEIDNKEKHNVSIKRQNLDWLKGANDQIKSVLKVYSRGELSPTESKACPDIQNAALLLANSIIILMENGDKQEVKS
jgi:hypothetical protein